MPTAGYNLTEILKVGNGVYFFRTCKANFSRKLKMSELLLLKIKGYQQYTTQMDKIRGFTCYANIEVTEVIPLSITAGKGLLFVKFPENVSTK